MSSCPYYLPYSMSSYPYHRVQELSPDISGWKIKVYVQKVFKNPLVEPKRFQLGLILVDEWGYKIEATFDRDISNFYSLRVKENQWKIMTSFIVRYPAGGLPRPTNHGYEIFVTDRTIVTNTVGREMDVFNRLIPFDPIMNNTYDISQLVDLIGAVTYVSELISFNPRQGDNAGCKMYFRIKDKYDHELPCMATGETALIFHDNFRRSGRINMVIALLMWRVDRVSFGRDGAMIVSHATYSQIFPEPDTPQADDIRMVLARDQVSEESV